MTILFGSKIDPAVIAHPDESQKYFQGDNLWRAIATPITTSSSSYTITGTNNQYIGHSAPTNGVTITLPSATTAGQIIFVGDESGNCSDVNYIKIVPTGSDTISERTSIYLLIASARITLIANGSTKWTVADSLTTDISSYNGTVLDNQTSEHYRCSSCSWTCLATCTESCGGSCNTTCSGKCATGCTSGCDTGCKNGCKNGCTGCSGCSGNCTGGCTGCGTCSTGR